MFNPGDLVFWGYAKMRSDFIDRSIGIIIEVDDAHVYVYWSKAFIASDSLQICRHGKFYVQKY